jgi:hypothetical protein
MDSAKANNQKFVPFIPPEWNGTEAKCPILREDVVHALKNMKPESAQGPDGFDINLIRRGALCPD